MNQINHCSRASFLCLVVIIPSLVAGSAIAGSESVQPAISVLAAQISGQHSAQINFAAKQLSLAFANTTAKVRQGPDELGAAHLTVFVGPGNSSGMLPPPSSLADILGDEGCLCLINVTNTSPESLAATVAVTGSPISSARGTINGVFELLRALGFRFWAPGVVDLPKNLPRTNAGAVAYELVQRLLSSGWVIVLARLGG